MTTTITDAVRKEQIAKALEAHDPTREPSPRVQWKGHARTFPQIRLGLEYVLLNPHSHRIRAQLESDEHAQTIKDNPFTDEAQDHIARLLRETEGFPRLKQNIDQEGQLDYGIVTAAGVLVNANTRAVALRDLGKSHIDVIVLPEDATSQEIAELELGLQMQEDLRQDYTFTNELLFVEDLLQTYQLPEDEVALKLRWATSRAAGELKRGRERVQQATRMLQIIRDIQQTSAENIKLTFFDDKRQSLIEIDQQYQRLRQREPKTAVASRNARTLGLLTDVGYEGLREIDDTFVDDYLVREFNKNPVLKDTWEPLLKGNGSTSGDMPEGLDVLDDGGGDGDTTNGGGSVTDVGQLVEVLAKAKDGEKISLPTTEGGTKELAREVVMDAVTNAVHGAVEDARTDTKKGTRLERPIGLLDDADAKLKKALERYLEVQNDPNFDDAAFRDRIEKIQRRVDALNDAL